MRSFAAFDTRGYRTVSAREGYDRWAATYEDTVEDGMDLALLEWLEGDWGGGGAGAGLGWGEGRTGGGLAGAARGALRACRLPPALHHRLRHADAFRRCRVG